MLQDIETEPEDGTKKSAQPQKELKKAQTSLNTSSEKHQCEIEAIEAKNNEIYEKDTEIQRQKKQISELQQEIEENKNTHYAQLKAKDDEINAKDADINRLRKQISDLQEQNQELDTQLKAKDGEINAKDADIQRLEKQISDLQEQSQHLYTQLKTKDDEISAKDADIQRQISDLQKQNQDLLKAKDDEINTKDADILRQEQQISDLQLRVDESQDLYSITQVQLSYSNKESWEISRDEIQQLAKREIGRGAWGVVYSGTFHGEQVAIKQAYTALLHGTTIDMLKREVMIMAHVQHPNLVRFIGAVLDKRVFGGIDTPIIVSELMDMNLRSAYNKVDLSSNLISIFCDVAYALHYLHQHRPSIIHRDVSAPNVLLKTLRNGGYQAKVSDFGSANLAKRAQTAGAGAIIYCAPEMFPKEDITAPPDPQTTKVDVYSYGILMMEVIEKEMPTPETRHTMLLRVSKQWELMYDLIVHCTKALPSDRPSMSDLLNKLNKLPH